MLLLNTYQTDHETRKQFIFKNGCRYMPIFFIKSNRYLQYWLQLVISKHFQNYTVVTYDDIYTVSQSIYNISWVAIDER